MARICLPVVYRGFNGNDFALTIRYFIVIQSNNFQDMSGATKQVSLHYFCR